MFLGLMCLDFFLSKQYEKEIENKRKRTHSPKYFKSK